MATLLAVDPMAKKRIDQGGVTPEPDDSKTNVVSFRVTDSYHQWLKKLCKREGRRLPDEIAYLLEERARAIGFDAPPDRTLR